MYAYFPDLPQPGSFNFFNVTFIQPLLRYLTNDPPEESMFKHAQLSYFENLVIYAYMHVNKIYRVSLAPHRRELGIASELVEFYVYIRNDARICRSRRYESKLRDLLHD